MPKSNKGESLPEGHYSTSDNLLVKYLGDALKAQHKNIPHDFLTQDNLLKIISIYQATDRAGKTYNIGYLNASDALKCAEFIAKCSEFTQSSSGNKAAQFQLFDKPRSFFGIGSSLLTHNISNSNNSIDTAHVLSNIEKSMGDKLNNKPLENHEILAERVRTKRNYSRICSYLIAKELMHSELEDDQSKKMLATLNKAGRKQLASNLEKIKDKNNRRANVEEIKAELQKLHSKASKYVDQRAAQSIQEVESKGKYGVQFTLNHEMGPAMRNAIEERDKRIEEVKKNGKTYQPLNPLEYLIDRFPLLSEEAIVGRFKSRYNKELIAKLASERAKKIANELSKKEQEYNLDEIQNEEIDKIHDLLMGSPTIDIMNYEKLDDLGRILQNDSRFNRFSSRAGETISSQDLGKMVNDAGNKEGIKISDSERFKEHFERGFIGKTMEEELKIRDAKLRERDEDRTGNKVDKKAALDYLQGVFLNLQPEVLETVFSGTSNTMLSPGSETKTRGDGLENMTYKELDELGRMLSSQKRFLRSSYEDLDGLKDKSKLIEERIKSEDLEAKTVQYIGEKKLYRKDNEPKPSESDIKLYFGDNKVRGTLAGIAKDCIAMSKASDIKLMFNRFLGKAGAISKKADKDVVDQHLKKFRKETSSSKRF